jgi:hypothetical protein
MRGNRTVKVDSGNLDAFHSPNMDPLVVAGISLEVNYKDILRPTTIEKVALQTVFLLEFFSQFVVFVSLSFQECWPNCRQLK